VPLSEEEQRILQELEQKLYEQDRAFVDRVRAEGPGRAERRSVRWAAAAFLAGFVVVLVSFRSSVVLGTFGFLVMLFSALLFERNARLAYGRGQAARPRRALVSGLGRRLKDAPRPRFRRGH
jgi:hypothetical protein